MALSLSFFDMFGKSPIKPLQEHMSKANSCVEMLGPFFEAAIAGDWDAVNTTQVAISDLERQADELKRELRLHLPTGLFMPVPRTDIITLLMVQDKVANKAEDIAGLATGRRMAIPEAIAQEFMALLNTGIEASKQALKAINELDELLQTGFSGNEVTLVETMIRELDQIESHSDELQVSIRKQIFTLESDLPPVDVMFLYKIVEWVGELADRAQTVGHQLQLLLAR